MRAHTQRFKTEATGFVTPSGKRRVCVALTEDQVEKANSYAVANNISVSSALSDLIDIGVASLNAGTQRLNDQEVALINAHRQIFGRQALQEKEGGE